MESGRLYQLQEGHRLVLRELQRHRLACTSPPVLIWVSESVKQKGLSARITLLQNVFSTRRPSWTSATLTKTTRTILSTDGRFRKCQARPRTSHVLRPEVPPLLAWAKACWCRVPHITLVRLHLWWASQRQWCSNSKTRMASLTNSSKMTLSIWLLSRTRLLRVNRLWMLSKMMARCSSRCSKSSQQKLIKKRQKSRHQARPLREHRQLSQMWMTTTTNSK